MAVTLESLRKSVGKKNTNSMVFAWLADLEREAGELDKALQRVDGGLTLYPNDISARLVRAKILTQLEAYQPCVEECERIIVMDPFNLAAQQLMGNAYDKLGMQAERNVCYRRLHDMDPLNNFWKEEYDVVLESTVAATAAAAVAADSEFSMSDTPSESGEQASSLDMSFGDAAPSTADAGANSFEMPATADSIDSPVAEETSGEDSSDENMADDPFASLAAMLPNGDSAEDSTMEDLSASLESAMDSIKTDESEGLVEDFGAEENISGSDVSSALSDMFGLDDDLEPEETTTSASPFANPASKADVPVSIDDNAVSNAASVFETARVEDDKPQSIDDAFGDIFGEDELPEEKPVEKHEDAESSVFASMSMESLAEAPLAQGTSEALPADEATLEEVSADDAFAHDGGLFEKSKDFSKPAEADKPQSIDDAFGDIFGEDELPEEKPQAAAPKAAESLDLPAEEEGGLFEKSASADMNLSKPADEPMTIDNAFDSIFGEDELPEEKPAVETPAAAAPAAENPVEEKTLEETPAADSFELPTLESPIDNLFADDNPADEKPATEESLTIDDAPALESPIDNLFADDTPATTATLEEELPAATSLETLAEETPVAEELVAETPAVETPVAEPEQPTITQDAALSVDSAFSSIFGDDDDLPVENSAAVKPAAEIKPVEIQPEDSASLEEQVNKAEAELEMPAAKSEGSSDLAQEMGGAFASMFGNTDDDLDLPEVKAPAETKEPEQDDQELTGAPVEEGFDKPVDETLSKDIDKSFDNLFGENDDLDVPAEKSAQTASEAPAKSAPELPTVETAQDLDSLESEVSGAFKGLFDMDDDSLTEETKPANKGVDFLMSGDSDDEISAGLINDPDAPLDRGAQDLDESLNTRTLAEIYFDQGLYGKALEIYKDLAQKEPENEDIAVRLSEVEKLYKEKFGGNA